MKVQIQYHDDASFTVEEIVKQAQNFYGKQVRVEVSADSSLPHDLIAFALQQIITFKQLALLYDNKELYNSEIKILRAETLVKLQEILDMVIIDNESKIV